MKFVGIQSASGIILALQIIAFRFIKISGNPKFTYINKKLSFMAFCRIIRCFCHNENLEIFPKT